MLHRLGSGGAVHRGHDRVEVRDIHDETDALGILGVDERPDVGDAERAEDLLPLRRGKPVLGILDDVVVGDHGWHGWLLGAGQRRQPGCSEPMALHVGAATEAARARSTIAKAWAKPWCGFGPEAARTGDRIGIRNLGIHPARSAAWTRAAWA